MLTHFILILQVHAKSYWWEAVCHTSAWKHSVKRYRHSGEKHSQAQRLVLCTTEGSPFSQHRPEGHLQRSGCRLTDQHSDPAPPTVRWGSTCGCCRKPNHSCLVWGSLCALILTSAVRPFSFFSGMHQPSLAWSLWGPCRDLLLIRFLLLMP